MLPFILQLKSEANLTARSAAAATEYRKIETKGANWDELGWICVPLVVEQFGAWGQIVTELFSKLASHPFKPAACTKSSALSNLYKKLNPALVCSNGRAFHACYESSDIIH